MRKTAVFLLCTLLLAFFLPADPARALDKRVMGDVHVEKGETIEEISTAWGNVTVEGDVKGDIRSGFGNIIVEGPVGGDVEAGFGDVRVNAPVGGDVKAGFGNLELDRGAQVKGNISYHSGRLDRHQNAIVAGSQMTGMASDFDDGSPLGAISSVIGWIVMTLILVAAAVLLAVAAPRPLRASARSLETTPGRSLVLGLVSVPAAIVASILLAITVVGILLLLLLWPAYLALLLFGALVVAYFLGRKVLLVTGGYRAGDALAAAVGALLVSAAYLIPFLGGLVFAVLALLGAGAAVLALLTRRPSGAPRTTYASYEDYLRDRR
jgi:cytoskeletal protein CcmA (bactofilin family)